MCALVVVLLLVLVLVLVCVCVCVCVWLGVCVRLWGLMFWAEGVGFRVSGDADLKGIVLKGLTHEVAGGIELGR